MHADEIQHGLRLKTVSREVAKRNDHRDLAQVFQNRVEKAGEDFLLAVPLASRQADEMPGDVFVPAVTLFKGIVQANAQNGVLRLDRARQGFVKRLPIGRERNKASRGLAVFPVHPQQPPEQERRRNED